MKCSRCECQFSATSAMVTDHRYVQECIAALKAEIRRLMEEHANTPLRTPPPPTLSGAVYVSTAGTSTSTPTVGPGMIVYPASSP